MTTNANEPNAHRLYREALELDRTFSEALRLAYGSDRAGTMRYKPASWSRDVRIAWARWEQAMAALDLEREYREARTRSEQDKAIDRCQRRCAAALELRPFAYYCPKS